MLWIQVAVRSQIDVSVSNSPDVQRLPAVPHVLATCHGWGLWQLYHIAGNVGLSINKIVLKDQLK